MLAAHFWSQHRQKVPIAHRRLLKTILHTALALEWPTSVQSHISGGGTCVAAVGICIGMSARFPLLAHLMGFGSRQLSDSTQVQKVCQEVHCLAIVNVSWFGVRLGLSLRSR